MSSPALFLDRDGVINVDHAYVYQPEKFDFIDDVFGLCQEAQKRGYKICVITNQAGIGRGYYTEQDFMRLTEWMLDVFKQHEVVINKVYFCPHHPDGLGSYQQDSFFRKPNPGMILQAEQELDIDLKRSIFVGDKLTDMQAGKSAGILNNLLYSPESIESAIPQDVTVVKSLLDVVSFLTPI